MSKTKSQSAETEARAAEAAEAEQGAPDENAKTDAGGKAERGEQVSPAAWKTPDYSGPLSGEQALWRNRNIQRK